LLLFTVMRRDDTGNHCGCRCWRTRHHRYHRMCHHRRRCQQVTSLTLSLI